MGEPNLRVFVGEQESRAKKSEVAEMHPSAGQIVALPRFSFTAFSRRLPFWLRGSSSPLLRKEQCILIHSKVNVDEFVIRQVESYEDHVQDSLLSTKLILLKLFNFSMLHVCSFSLSFQS